MTFSTNVTLFWYALCCCHVDRSGGVLGVDSGHQFVDAGCWPTVDELGQCLGEPGMRVHTIEFAGLDQRGDDRPVGAAFVTVGEEYILTIERDGPD
jgi:hypothetical protein